MNKDEITSIIVDDEPLAQDILTEFISKIPFIKNVDSCKTGFEAIRSIEKHKPDLIFLDIQMPELTGIELANSLKSAPMIIFTTAYPNYAVKGFDLNAVDYLLKPFAFERFLKAVTKAYDSFALSNKIPGDISSKEKKSEYIFVKVEYQTVRIDIKNILYIEGLKDYVKIYTGPKPVLTLMTLKSLGEKLPADNFIRVHRSFIIAIDKINAIQRNRIIINEKYIPIGDKYKNEFYEKIGQDF